MTNSALITHYAICITAAIVVGYYITPWLAPFSFIVTSTVLVAESETRPRK